MSYAMASGFDEFKLKGVTIEVGVVDRKSQMQIADLAAPRTVRPGEDVELIVTLAGENGVESQRKVLYRAPVGAPLGPINFTAAGAGAADKMGVGGAVGVR